MLAIVQKIYTLHQKPSSDGAGHKSLDESVSYRKPSVKFNPSVNIPSNANLEGVNL